MKVRCQCAEMKSHWNPITLVHLCVLIARLCVSTAEPSVGDGDRSAHEAGNVLPSGPLQRETFVLLHYVEPPPFKRFF